MHACHMLVGIFGGAAFVGDPCECTLLFILFMLSMPFKENGPK